MELTGAQIVVNALKKAGVDTLFGYPGGQALPLYDAGVAWFLPAVVGSLLGLLIPAKK